MIMSSVEAEPVCAALEQVFLIFFLLCSELVLLYFSECVSVVHSFVEGSHGCVCCFRFAAACFVIFLLGVIQNSLLEYCCSASHSLV